MIRPPKPPSAYALLLSSSIFIFSAFSTLSAATSAFDSNHHIIFNHVGQLAASMSYLHVGIPVNLSSVQHHISAYNSYLQTFSSLTTSHPDKQQFARLLQELSAFASEEMTELNHDLRFLDHILPEDNTPPPPHPRHKRFVDYVMLELCKKDFHNVRVEQSHCSSTLKDLDLNNQLCSIQLSSLSSRIIPSISYLSQLPVLRSGRQFAIKHLNNCESDKLDVENSLRYCKEKIESARSDLTSCLTNLTDAQSKANNLPLTNPTHIPFTNISSTTTTTPPPPSTYPFYPFAPTRPPYHSTHPIRGKRQILAAAALATGVLGTFLGLFNNNEINEIKTQLLNLNDQHNILTKIVQKHEHELLTLHDQLQHLTTVVETLLMYNPTLVYAVFQKNIHKIRRKLDSFISTLQQLQHQRLSVRLLDEHQLNIVFDSIKNTALQRQIKLLPARPQDLFQLDTSYIRQGDEILIIVHVPCTVTDHLLTLYEYVPFPYPLHPSPTPRVPSEIKTLQDFADSHPSKTSSALFFKSDYKMIAIGRNFNLNTASYKLISQADLAACIQKNHLYLCEHHQTLRKDLPGSCLGALYLQHEIGVIENCQIDRRPLRETTFQLSPLKHIIFSPTPLTTQILCNNGSHFPLKLFGTNYITIPPLCSVDLLNSTLSSDGNIRISPDPLIFEWKFQPNLLPTDLLSTSQHIDLQLSQIRSNLSDFRSRPNESISDEQFSALLVNHMTSYSHSSMILWLSLFLTFAVGLITIVCACCICNSARRRRRLRQRRHLSVPMSVLAAYDASAPDDEDEISYIARTGRIPQSSGLLPVRNTSIQK